MSSVNHSPFGVETSDGIELKYGFWDYFRENESSNEE